MTSQTSSSSPVPVLSGLSSIAQKYPVLFCDVWGVLHNGVKAFAPAVDALTRYREKGGTVILVSNAPRPGRFVLPQLAQFGVPDTAFDVIVTSGDVSREEIEARAGQKVLHIGPERDLTIFEGTGSVITDASEADYVVCTGLVDDDTETVATYQPVLDIARARNLWMLCANPDLVVERGNTLIPCAGSIAAAYEEMGGEVCWAGKPHGPIYRKALDRASEIAGKPFTKKDVLAIGDAIRTDVAGAVNFGVDVLMVARGIHAEILGIARGERLTSAHVQEWLAAQKVQPQAIIDELKW